MKRAKSREEQNDRRRDELQALVRLPLELAADVPAESLDAFWRLHGCLTVHLASVLEHEPADAVFTQNSLRFGLKRQADFLNSEARATLAKLGAKRLARLVAPYRASLERLNELPVEPDQRSKAARQLIASGLATLSELLLHEDQWSPIG